VPALGIEQKVAEAVALLSVSDFQLSAGSQRDQQGASRLSCSPEPEQVRLAGGDTDAKMRAAVERVVISRTTIEIELAEATAGDSQNRVLIIPWTPSSPHRRREIIQGEGDQSFAMRLAPCWSRCDPAESWKSE
jgi:hypothetical protein